MRRRFWKCEVVRIVQLAPVGGGTALDSVLPLGRMDYLLDWIYASLLPEKAHQRQNQRTLYTQTGRMRLSQINRLPVESALNQAPQIEAQRPEADGWLHFLVQVFTKHSRT